MRLAEHSLHCYRLRDERPVRWSDIVEEAAPFVLLRLQSDTGLAGVAEITVKPTWRRGHGTQPHRDHRGGLPALGRDRGSR
jgi:hypothetical protein